MPWAEKDWCRDFWFVPGTCGCEEVFHTHFSESSAFYFDEQTISNQIDNYSKNKGYCLIEEVVFQVLVQL